MQDMPRPRLPYLRHEKNRHGTLCWYFRKDNGPRIRIRAAYGTPEFRAAYDAALTGTAPTTAPVARNGTLRWLVERYMQSGAFLALAESSRYFRGRFLRKAVQRAGDRPFAAVTRRHIQVAMEERSRTPFEANNFLVAMNKLFAWAVDHGHMATNPCDGVKPFRTKIEGHPTWIVDLVERYRAHHPVGSRARLAIDLLLFTGLRRGDIIVAGRQHVRDGVLSIQTRKNGAWVHVPVCAALMASMEAAPSGHLTFLVGERGRPFRSGGSFTAWFRKRCDEAHIPAGYSAHGLRKAGATIAADAGSTVHELMAMFGWRKIAMAEVYTKEADKRRLARAAAERIANAFSAAPEISPPHLGRNTAENKG